MKHRLAWMKNITTIRAINFRRIVKREKREEQIAREEEGNHAAGKF